MPPSWPFLLLPLLVAATPDPMELGALRVTGFAGATYFETGEPSELWREVGFQQWSVEREGIWRRVVERRLGPRSRRTLSRYLAPWRRGHACTANELAGLPPVGGASAPPQLTFEGVCEPGDRYIIRVLIVGDRAYELHVDGRFAPRPRLHAAMRDLLGQIELVAGRDRIGAGAERR